jgi:hypothetical protein
MPFGVSDLNCGLGNVIVTLISSKPVLSLGVILLWWDVNMSLGTATSNGPIVHFRVTDEWIKSAGGMTIDNGKQKQSKNKLS